MNTTSNVQARRETGRNTQTLNHGKARPGILAQGGPCSQPAHTTQDFVLQKLTVSGSLVCLMCAQGLTLNQNSPPLSSGYFYPPLNNQNV